MTRQFFALRVAAVEAETASAASLGFDIPPALTEAFHWRPGQHVTLRFHLAGEQARRTYSISSSPAAGDPLRITVKRIAGGLVSNHVNDAIRAGSRVEVMPPFGSFVLEPDPRRRRTLYLIGAGSGITPLYAMLRSVLKAEPWSAVHLLYGNRSGAAVLFKGEMSRLQAEHPGRLTVSHVLSDAARGEDCFHRGRIDAAVLHAWIEKHPPYAQDARYFVCGPGGMNRAARDALADVDVPAERIHAESYGGATAAEPQSGAPAAGVSGVASAAAIVLGGRRHEVRVAAAQTLLDAARSAGLDPPYSCEAGVCGACRAILEDGSVRMRAKAALTEADLDAGAILTCQAVATSGRVAIRYDEG